jgi:hypothetical protein
MDGTEPKDRHFKCDFPWCCMAFFSQEDLDQHQMEHNKSKEASLGESLQESTFGNASVSFDLCK